MKIFACSLFLVLTIGKIACSQQTSTAVAGVRVVSILPVNTPGGLEIDTFSNDRYYKDELCMLRITTHVDSGANGRIFYAEFRYSYFVYHRDSLYGIHYVDKPGTGAPAFRERLRVDSTLKMYSAETTTFDNEEGRLPDSSFAEGEGLVNVYQYKHNDKFPEDFTFYYHYSKAFSNLPVSFSKKFDTYQGLKLNKIDVHAQGAYYKQGKQTLPARDYIYLMTEVPAADIKVAEEYFARYSKGSKR
jgi:hypothetical protein